MDGEFWINKRGGLAGKSDTSVTLRDVFGAQSFSEKGGELRIDILHLLAELNKKDLTPIMSDGFLEGDHLQNVFLKLQTIYDVKLNTQDKNFLDILKKACADSEAPQAELQDLGLSYTPVPGDGHCLYHAAALYLGIDQQSLRTKVADYISQHKNEFAGFIQITIRLGGQQVAITIDEYIDRIRKGQEWADNIEIEALMRSLQRRIIIVDRQMKIRNLQDSTRFTDVAQGNNLEPIYVYFNPDKAHYDALPKLNNYDMVRTLNVLTTNTRGGAPSTAPAPVDQQSTVSSRQSSSNEQQPNNRLNPTVDDRQKTIDQYLQNSRQPAAIVAQQSGNSLPNQLLSRINASTASIVPGLPNQQATAPSPTVNVTNQRPPMTVSPQQRSTPPSNQLPLPSRIISTSPASLSGLLPIASAQHQPTTNAASPRPPMTLTQQQQQRIRQKIQLLPVAEQQRAMLLLQQRQQLISNTVSNPLPPSQSQNRGGMLASPAPGFGSVGSLPPVTPPIEVTSNSIFHGGIFSPPPGSSDSSRAEMIPSSSTTTTSTTNNESQETLSSPDTVEYNLPSSPTTTSTTRPSPEVGLTPPPTMPYWTPSPDTSSWSPSDEPSAPRPG